MVASASRGSNGAQTGSDSSSMGVAEAYIGAKLRGRKRKLSTSTSSRYDERPRHALVTLDVAVEPVAPGSGREHDPLRLPAGNRQRHVQIVDNEGVAHEVG